MNVTSTLLQIVSRKERDRVRNAARKISLQKKDAERRESVGNCLFNAARKQLEGTGWIVARISESREVPTGGCDPDRMLPERRPAAKPVYLLWILDSADTIRVWAWVDVYARVGGVWIASRTQGTSVPDTQHERATAEFVSAIMREVEL